MAVPILQPSFSAGEVSPELFGREDFAKLHVAAATMRNCFVSYRGGAYSRAGSAFVGYSKQTGRSYPPRLISFQYNINQGLVLEFGNQYMRVIYDGAVVTETVPYEITNVSNASPAVITATPTSAASAASIASGVVTSSYDPGDTITLAGGSYVSPAVLEIALVTIQTISPSAPGAGYAPNDTIDLAGGSQTEQAVITVSSTQLSQISLLTGGSYFVGLSPANGTYTFTGYSGTGTKYKVSCLLVGGAVTKILSIISGGAYTTNPTAAEYIVAPGTLTTNFSATVAPVMGVLSVALTNGGLFTSTPSGDVLSQSSTTGNGNGAIFIGVFSPFSINILQPGSYTVTPSNPVSQASTSGAGAGATFTMTWANANIFNDGDWVYISGIPEIPIINGQTVIIRTAGTGQWALYDVFGNPISTLTQPVYSGGGLAYRIYTLATPWGEADLVWMKFIQSANVMSICCVNQDSQAEYPPFDLTRVLSNQWTLTQIEPEPTIEPPATCTGVASASGSIYYQYVVTAVNPEDNTESVASPIASINGAVNIAQTAGSITLTCGDVPLASKYNWYKATPGYAAAPPAGALFGYAGSSYSTQFVDTNIIADFAQVPPFHGDPFGRGAVSDVTVLTVGSNIATITPVVTTVTGTGLVIQCIIVGGQLANVLILYPGDNYQPTDTITFNVTGAGAVAPTANLVVGPQSGTYPGVVSYFQERRVYANSLNNPDTYWMSQPGAFTNFDYRDPTIDSDSIEGSPWSLQVNGIQFMVPMPGGLVVLTGLSAWQIGGPGSSASNPQPITPSGQQATSQAYNGCNPTLPPIRIENFILYVQAKGSIYRLLSYNFWTNIYTGGDQTIFSSQLFTGYTMVAHAYSEEPYKVIWAVRNDGVLLSNTFLPAQEINGWARHDTQGLYKSICSIVEPPVDAVYTVVERSIAGNVSYMLERFDDRIWSTNENCWCVDAGLSLAQPAPSATLYPSSTTGLGAVIGVTNLVGGLNYGPLTYATVTDVGGGPGTGAIPVVTIGPGGSVSISFPPGNQGSGYLQPEISVVDPSNAGSGFSASCVLNNSATFSTSAPIFSPASIGNAIRAAGGKAVITAYVSSTQVTANIIYPLAQTIPGAPLSFPSGSWTLSAPVSIIGGLWHLAGATVVGTADGSPIPPTVVGSDGTLVLPFPASNVIAGLSFTPQLQSVYLDAGEPTQQGRRKKIAGVTARVFQSYGFEIGANQPDGSVLSPPQIAPTWIGMQPPAQTYGPVPFGVTAPQLFTGDVRIPVASGFKKRGQAAIQQPQPYPLNLLAFITEFEDGDKPETTPRRGGGQ